MTRHDRFAGYVTAGAFALNLTRNQAAELNRLVGEGAHYLDSHAQALERKGLVERVAAPTEHDADRFEWRLTDPGLVAVQLLAFAGLSNGPADPQAVELAALRRELETARAESADARLMARAAFARRDVALQELELAQAKISDHKPRIILRARDPRPDLSDADLRSWCETGSGVTP